MSQNNLKEQPHAYNPKQLLQANQSRCQQLVPLLLEVSRDIRPQPLIDQQPAAPNIKKKNRGDVENHRKTMGKWWFNGGLMGFDSYNNAIFTTHFPGNGEHTNYLCLMTKGMAYDCYTHITGETRFYHDHLTVI